MTDPIMRRVDFGYFVRHAEETGSGSPRVEPCLGYLIDHPSGLLLVDSGMGMHPDVDAHYGPRRRSLSAALHEVGVRREEIAFVVNRHLHFDHCGGNPELTGRTVLPNALNWKRPGNRLTTPCLNSSMLLVWSTRSSTAKPKCCRVSSSCRLPATLRATRPWSFVAVTAPSLWLGRATIRPAPIAPTFRPGAPTVTPMDHRCWWRQPGLIDCRSSTRPVSCSPMTVPFGSFDPPPSEPCRRQSPSGTGSVRSDNPRAWPAGHG